MKKIIYLCWAVVLVCLFGCGGNTNQSKPDPKPGAAFVGKFAASSTNRTMPIA